MDPIPVHLEAAIRTRLRERRTPGLAVCCFDSTRVCFAGGVGEADLERGEPVTASTVFRVASISKLVTTALVLAAVQGGGFDLDDAVNRLLPSTLQIMDPRGGPATSSVRTLLSHVSGLPPSTRGTQVGNSALSWLVNRGRVRNLAEAVSNLQLRHEPGDRIMYSNAAFNVAGFIAAAAFGQPFEAAVRQQVLSPLGLSDAGFDRRPGGVGVATPYGRILPPAAGASSAERLQLVATPMGGLTVSALGLAAFGQMVLNDGAVGGRRLVSRELLDEATSMQALNHPLLEQGYGLGFKVRTWRGRTTIGHDGNMPGVATQLLLSPEDGVGVVVLTNGYSLAVPHEIADLALGDLLGVPAGDAPPPPRTASARDRLASAGRKVEGTYRFADPLLPGAVGRLGDLMTRSRLTHETGGRLRLHGNPGSDGPAWLLPDAEPGCYRVAAGVDDGTNAVVEHRPDGVHLWLGHATRLHRRRTS